MTTAEQVRAINAELQKRLGGGMPATLRDLALDIHQAIADAAEMDVQAGVDRLAAV